MRRRLNAVIVYRFLIGLLVLLGIQPLLRLPQEIGQLYLGVPLTPLFTGEFFINIETSSHWPGIQAGLRARDRVLSIEGRSVIHAPHVFAEVYAGHREGDPVQVEVQRGAERLIITVPLRRYRLAEALELFGLWFLAGLSAAVAAWFLFRPTTALMAHAMALVAGLLFAHSYSGYADPRLSVTGFYLLEPMWSYSYSLLGAVLLHFAWRFPPREPADHSSAWRVSWKLVGLYGLAFALGTMLEFATVIKWIEANRILTQAGLMLAGVGAVVGLLRLAWLCTRPLAGQAGARVIAGVWGIGTVLLLGIGVLPYWSSDLGMLLAQFLLSIAVIYPLLLVYAVRQVELVEALEHEVAEKQRWADLVQEVQRFREEDLRRVANELHDTVLADLRAVELRLESLMPGDETPTAESDPQAGWSHRASAVELQTLRETVRQIGQQARRVTVGAMPLEFQEVGLREALQEAVERFQRMAPEVEARLAVGPFDAEPSPAVREAAYWIAVSALNNCRQHAQASQVRVFVSAEEGHVQVTVRDDGVGFRGAEEADFDAGIGFGGSGGAGEHRGRGEFAPAPPHLRTPAPWHGLGLRNMRARAEALGGELQIDSGPRGTTVRFSLTLARERRVRMLVVEDSEAFVEGLRAALARWAREVEIVGATGNTQEALARAEALRPDIVLLDLRIRESPEAEEADARHGLQALLGLVRMSKVRTVVMSFTHDPAWLRAVFEIGAWAFWHKDQEVASLVELLRRVAAGERVLMAEEWAGAEKEYLVEQLTPREWEVLLYVEQGLTNQEVAGQLGISVRTVAKHVENIRGKLGVRSRSEALAKARALGLLSAGRPEFPPPPDGMDGV